MFNTSINNALTRANSDLIAGYGMPSTIYEELTLGVSGESYQAPANGWFYVSKTSGSSGKYVSIRHPVTQMNSNSGLSSANNNWLETNLPVLKGDTIEVNYTATGTTNYFRFIYASGDV